MIRKVVIVVLLSLAAASLVGMLVGFGSSPPWTTVDTQWTTVYLLLWRGSLCIAVARIDLGRIETSEEILAETEDLRRQYRVQTGVMIYVSNVERMGPRTFEFTSQWLNGAASQFSGSGSAFITFPLWVPLALFAAYPTFAFIRGPLRRHRRRKRNQCVHCGYNLTGLPEPRCPECGEPI